MIKKIYLIFLSFLTIPLFLSAQQKPVGIQNQLPQKNLQAAPITKPTETSKEATPVKSSHQPTANGGKKPITHRRRHAPTTYGNEWINYNQYYFKIKVAQNGIYRMDSLALAKSGIPVDTIKTSHYQIYFREQQQYIYVKSSTTYLSEKNGDYIEFYGQPNDGVPDSSLYYKTRYFRFLPNPYYSLFNDSSTYYLTWDPTGAQSHLRMAEVFDTSWTINHYTASPYVMTSTVFAPNIQYSQGSWQPDGSYTPNDPRFTQNSAWTNPWIFYNSGSQTYSLNINSLRIYGAGPNAFMRTVVLGEDTGTTSNCTFNIKTNNNNAPVYTNIPCKAVIDSNGNYVFAAIDTFMVIPALYTPTSITFTNNAPSNISIIAPAYVYMNYPHTLILDGVTTFAMQVPNNTTGPTKTYLDFTSFTINGAADSARMYDLANHKRFWVKPQGGGFKVIVPNSGGLKNCYLTSDSAIYKVTSLTPVGINHLTGGPGNGKFTNFATEGDSAFIIITHPFLWQEAEAYATYRKNNLTKHYDTVVADVEELYDQFGEGVDYSPLGIRRFCQYAINKWPTPPSNLFLVGKGIHTPLMRPDTAVWSRSQMLVPSYGYPSSDILFTSTLDSNGPLEPAIPTGRLAAATGDEVSTYLNKVEIYESAPAALWMKNIAHFAGGDNLVEEAPLVNFLDDYAYTIEDTLFGGNVYLFQKASPNPILGTLTDSIVNLINNGVSIMTFFGHAGGANWDESIDFPTDYSNYNKYPFIMADACFSGDIYQPIGHAITSVSEQWILNGPGAIGFLASDYLGNEGELNSYTQNMYDDISERPFYRKPVGQIIQNTIATWEGSHDIFMTFTCLEQNLHGDPAIAINAMDSLPDYAVNNQSIYFTPSTVSVLQDTFLVHVIVYNYGEALDQIVAGTLTRTFPDNHQHFYNFSFAPPRYAHYLHYVDTVAIKVPVNDSNHLGQGLNYFTATVDLNPNAFKELTLANNLIAAPGVPLWITSEDITPVWPYDYAIIPNDTATLKASTNDPFAPQRTYIFEIDTSHSFNSPLFRSDTVTNSGGVIMAPPFANWGTTHFKGLLEKGAPGSGTNNKAPVKVKSTNINPAIATQSGTTESIKALQMAPVSNSQASAKQNTSAKQPTLSASQLGQAKANGISSANTNAAKIHKLHGPINLTFKDTTVYYWRVRRDTIDSTGIYNWVNTSFEYIKGKNGWGQSNFYQYDNDEIFNDNYDYITFNNPARGWSFNTQGVTLQCTTYGLTNTGCTSCITSTGFTINDYAVSPSPGCTFNEGIYVVIIDKTTLQPWSTSGRDYHNANDSLGVCGLSAGGFPDTKFIFWDSPSYPLQMPGLVSLLKAVPTGDYILAYTFYNGAFKFIPPNSGLADADSVLTELTRLGASQMFYHANTPGLDSVPWIFFVQKGVAGTAKQLYGTTSVTPVNSPGVHLSVDLSGNGTYGAIYTPLIGPAAHYDSLSWHQHPDDPGPLTDSTRLSIIGVSPNGAQKTLMSDITPVVANMYISSINPVLFPYIQLALYTKDGVHRTPAQMKWWRVFYQPVPEIAVNPNVYTNYHADTLQYGDNLNFQTTVQNISDWPIASTQLLTWVSTQNNTITYYNQGQMVKPLNPGDTAKISFVMNDANSNTNSLKSVWFEVNPEAYPDTRLEQYHFNNYASKTFYSYGDKINPVLDVTFDGIHILNNDIVSAQPNILMNFMDENKFLALKDPSDFKVYLSPLGSTPQLVPYGPSLSFTPAVLPHNKCSLLLTPTLTDGTYQLTVQGTDISGNFSANNSYTVDFQVINKPMITEVLNYPNPFSTSTRFVFILTGEQIPTTFKIQIMTVSGKIVKEINEDEIGTIHIGRNITQYAWDGTDQYGSKLANGVYLYRVVTNINGQGIDEYQQGYQGANIDKFFTKGWGKMYLMR